MIDVVIKVNSEEVKNLEPKFDLKFDVDIGNYIIVNFLEDIYKTSVPTFDDFDTNKMLTLHLNALKRDLEDLEDLEK